MATNALQTALSQGSQHKSLTAMQKRFVEELVSNGGNRTQAAIDAGYAEHTAKVQAYELLRKPHVLNEVMNATAAAMVSAAPEAVQRLTELLQARSEYVSLQASQDLLDRVGLKAPDKSQHQIAGDIRVSIDLS